MAHKANIVWLLRVSLHDWVSIYERLLQLDLVVFKLHLRKAYLYSRTFGKYITCIILLWTTYCVGLALLVKTQCYLSYQLGELDKIRSSFLPFGRLKTKFPTLCNSSFMFNYCILSITLTQRLGLQL